LGYATFGVDPFGEVVPWVAVFFGGVAVGVGEDSGAAAKVADCEGFGAGVVLLADQLPFFVSGLGAAVAGRVFDGDHGAGVVQVLDGAVCGGIGQADGDALAGGVAVVDAPGFVYGVFVGGQAVGGVVAVAEEGFGGLGGRVEVVDRVQVAVVVVVGDATAGEVGDFCDVVAGPAEGVDGSAGDVLDFGKGVAVVDEGCAAAQGVAYAEQFAVVVEGPAVAAPLGEGVVASVIAAAQCVAVGVVGTGVSGGVLGEVDDPAVAVHQGVAVVGGVADHGGVLPYPHGEGGVPAKAQRAVEGGGVFVAFAVRVFDLQQGAVAAIGPLPYHRNSAGGYL